MAGRAKAEVLAVDGAAHAVLASHPEDVAGVVLRVAAG